MQLKTDSHVQGFLNNPENTMNTELCANVGLVLLKLANHFSKSTSTYKANSSQSIILAQSIDASLEALSEKVAIQSEAVKKGWEYLQNKLKEAPNSLDSVTTWIDGEESTRLIDLKTTLALVYLALTDKNTFWLEALKKDLSPTASQKEKISFREQFENSYLKEENDRLLTLWNCFIALQSKNRCHLGIRNELAMTLNGVYPGVWFIEDFELFLRSFLSEHLHQLIETFKPSPILYRATVLAKMSGEHLEDFEKALEQSKPDLLMRIKNTCLDHGINPQHAKIIHFLEAMQDLDLSWEGNAIMSSLAALFDPNKTPDKLLLVIRNWAIKQFEFDNQGHKDSVICFAKVYKVNELYKSHQALLRIWNQEVITIKQLDQLIKNINKYVTECFAQLSPQLASNELHIEMDHFLIANSTFAKDAQCDWIENFFIHWGMAKNQRNRTPLIQLYDKLHSPQMQEKYWVTNAFLEQQFSQMVDEKVDVTPYLINRVFLHAITVHPKQWTGLFFNYLSSTYDFVLGEMAKQNLLGHLLKQDSYPQDLLSQLKYLQEYYQFLQEETHSKPASITTFIPMKDFIVCMDDFRFMMGRLLTTQHKTFINSLSNEDFQNIIKNYEHFNYVIKLLSPTQTVAFIDSLSNTFLKNLIENKTIFVSMINTHLTDHQKDNFINSLDNTFFEPLIKNIYDLDYVIEHLPETPRINFIKSLNNEFLKSLIGTVLDLEKMTERLKGDQKIEFMNSLDNEFLKNNITNVPSLIIMVEILTRDQKTNLINSLDNEFLKNLICYGYQLPLLIKIISELQRSDFISSLSNEFLKKIIKSPLDFPLVINNLPETQKVNFIDFFINSMSEGFLNTFKNVYLLNDVISCLSETQIPVFISHLEKKTITDCIKNITNYQYITNKLSKEQKKAFIDSLNKLDELLILIITQDTAPVHHSVMDCCIKKPEAINYRPIRFITGRPLPRIITNINPEQSYEMPSLRGFPNYSPNFFGSENATQSNIETENNTNSTHDFDVD